jgi:hypothetical protein
LPRWLQRLARALRGRAPARLAIADAPLAAGAPAGLVNGVRVPAWAEERPGEVAESAYEAVLARGWGAV